MLGDRRVHAGRAGASPDARGPCLGDSEVHVWRACLRTRRDLRTSSLSDGERQRAGRLRLPDDQRRWIAAHVFLREVLAHYLAAAPADVDILVAPGGKPELATPTVRFNLSRAGDLALCAVARDREVGVDVERVRGDLDLLGIARLAFSAELCTALAHAQPEEGTARFFTEWTRHEARTKCLGLGLANAAEAAFAPVTLAALTVDRGYAGALAVAGAVSPLVFDPVPAKLDGMPSSPPMVARWRFPAPAAPPGAEPGTGGPG